MNSNAAHMAAGDLKAATNEGRYCESIENTILLKHFFDTTIAILHYGR